MGEKYDEHARERRVVEPAKRSLIDGGTDVRAAFSRDRARVLHSAALRKLAGKTQVVGPGEGAEVSGVPRTRLTHSLEVAQIGRGIAEELGADADLVETGGLAHDIGHPPFGHNGEHALNEAAQACGGFEGNAQTLRILTRLEPKVLDDGSISHGLNLTRAALDAATKYPWPAKADSGKFGVYPDDIPVFAWMRDGAPDERTCIEAQIMDWADDIAYSVHDVEDGVLSRRLSLRMLTDPDDRTALAATAATYFSRQSVATLEAAAGELLALPIAQSVAGSEYDSSLHMQVELKRLTSELVGRFASAAVAATRAAYGTGDLCRYGACLEVPDRVAAEVALLKALALRSVMSDARRRAVQEGQRQSLGELVDVLTKRAPEALDRSLLPEWEAAGDDATRLRVVIDQIASLTDAQAAAWHAWHTGRHG